MKAHAAAALAALAVLAATAATGAAHVSVSPGQAVLSASTEFTITVPAEGGLTTNLIRVTFPSEVSVYAVADAPGWTTRILTHPDGRLRAAEWSGGLILPDHYAAFTVLGTPTEEGTAAWRSEQGTTDGALKQWTGPPETGGEPETGSGTPGPASPVVITADPGEDSAVGGSTATAWAGVIGIALGALALVGVGMLWSSRPAGLPPDGPDDGDTP